MADVVTVAPLRFRTADDWLLEGDLYQPAAPKLAILISAGTGYPRRFYDAAATYLARQGAMVLTYDYRGIGGSGAQDPRWHQIDYADWGRHDLTAAIGALAGAAKGLTLTHLAHSVGGHFIGLAPNHGRIARHAFVSVGTGYFGGHHLGNIPAELYFWWGLGSVALARHGHIPRAGGWRGEPLPPRLFRTWRRWSHRRAYFRPDLDGALAPHHYGAVTAPIRSWLFSDDPIATPATARDLLRVYPAAPHRIVMRSPAEIGQRRIGHDGAFRKGREVLWQDIGNWLARGEEAPEPA
ncbi:serine aminopeptidase domain-containing protein [Pseudooceanicola aestuarii]|uniref:alpha/beta hydrolase family protein n=1 Tax=Pseudooceanicola aestuarii TaxID=2697319 RepID=UPI0013D29BFA|nr:alpha/beta hydrolase [Pseudooceanicola aestuarii]